MSVLDAKTTINQSAMTVLGSRATSWWQSLTQSVISGGVPFSYVGLIICILIDNSSACRSHHVSAQSMRDEQGKMMLQSLA